MKRLQDPQPVREVLRQQWLPAALVMCGLSAVASWWLHDYVGRLLYAVPLGILVGGTVWFLLLLAAAEGWVAFAFDD
jgi:hypothetical protein